MADPYPIAGPGLPPMPGQGMLSPEQEALQQELTAADLPPPPEPAVGGTFQIDPARFAAPRRRLEWSSTAQAYLDPETGAVAGSGGGGAGGMGGVPEVAPAMPGMGMGAGGGAPGVAPEPPSPEQAVEYRAGAVLGERGIEQVRALRQQGVAEDVIRQRLGMPPAPAVPGGPPAPHMARVGGMGMARPAAPKLPPELQALNPEPGYYLPGYQEALEGADIPDEQKGQLRQQYDQWLATDPRGVEFREQEMGLGFAAKMSGFEQQKQAAEQKQLDAQRELYAQQQEKAKLQEAEFAQFRQDFEKDYQQISAEHRRSIDEMKATKVDPRRGQIPVLDMLALALGAAGSAFTGQPNFAQQEIQSRIDNDIRAQLADLGTLKDVAAAQQNRLGMLRQRLGDEQAAINMERQLQLDSAKAFLAEKKATAGSELARIDADRYTAEVDRQLSKAQIGYEKGIRVQAAIRADERMQQRRAAMGAAAAAKRKQREAAEMQRTGVGPWQQKQATEMHKRYVPQAGGFVASEKQASELASSLENSARLRSLTGELLSIAEGGIGKKIDPKTVARAGALWSEAVLIAKEQDKLGVIAGPDMELEAAKYRKPDKLFSMGAAAGLRQNLQLIQEAERSALRKTHVIPGEVGQFQDPDTGEPQYGYRLALPGRGRAPVAAAPIPELPVAP